MRNIKKKIHSLLNQYRNFFVTMTMRAYNLHENCITKNINSALVGGIEVLISDNDPFIVYIFCKHLF